MGLFDRIGERAGGRRPARFGTRFAVLLLAAIALVGLDRHPAASQPAGVMRQDAARGPSAPLPPDAQVALYDLEADERLGGHTIERHVGKSDRELAERLRREPQISAASTYTDLVTARRVVGAAVAQSRDRIRTWTGSGGGGRPNLVLNYRAPSGTPIGRSLSRRARTPVSASRALVVLRWLTREQRWIVLTSYPEAR